MAYAAIAESLMRDDGDAAHFLADLGLKIDEVRQATLDLLGHGERQSCGEERVPYTYCLCQMHPKCPDLTAWMLAIRPSDPIDTIMAVHKGNGGSMIPSTWLPSGCRPPRSS